MHKTQKKSKAYGSKEGHNHFHFICPVIVKHNYAWVVNFEIWMQLNSLHLNSRGSDISSGLFKCCAIRVHGLSFLQCGGIKGIFKEVGAALICSHWNWIPLFVCFFKESSLFIGVQQWQYRDELFIDTQFDSAAAILLWLINIHIHIKQIGCNRSVMSSKYQWIFQTIGL